MISDHIHDLEDDRLEQEVQSYAPTFPICLVGFNFAQLPHHLRQFSRPFAQAALKVLRGFKEHSAGLIADITEFTEESARNTVLHESSRAHAEAALQSLKHAKDSAVCAFLHVKPDDSELP